MSHAVRFILRLTVALGLFFQPGSATGGVIADVFTEGMFGVRWGMSASEIEAVFPSGEWRTQAGVRQFYVRDSRPVFQIERTKKNHLIFALDANQRLSAVAIEFPASMTTFSGVINRLQTALGPVSPPSASDGAPYAALTWPRDGDILVSASLLVGAFGRDLAVVTISRTGAQATEQARTTLGL